MATGLFPHVVRRRQRLRRDVDPYLRATGLVAAPFGLGTPHDFGADGLTALVLPGSSRLAVSHDAGITEDTLEITVDGHGTFRTPTLAADIIHKGEWVERGKSVTITRNGAAPGIVTVYILDDIGRLLQIGASTFV